MIIDVGHLIAELQEFDPLEKVVLETDYCDRNNYNVRADITTVELADDGKVVIKGI